MLVAGKQIKRRAFQSSSAQATSLSRESKNLRLKKKSKPNIVMIIDQLRLCLRTIVSHQAPSSTVRIPHICVLLVCAFFTTPPPCVCQHNLWHCHVTVCATIMSQTKVFGRDPTPSYIVVGLPSDSRGAKSHFVHCPLKIDLSLRRVGNILAPGRAHELGTAGQAGYCGCERAKSLLWAIFGILCHPKSPGCAPSVPSTSRS